MNRILILGASGFIGNALYKELCSYFDVYGTFYSNKSFAKNQHFIRYDLDYDGIDEIVTQVQPTIIISALRGDFAAQIEAHVYLTEYVKTKPCKLFFLSSANVFDAYSSYPSYEFDKTLSESIYGKLKIRIENMLMRLPQKKYAIIRLPMVFGHNSPRILEIKQCLKEKIPVEVFPNLVMNTISDKKLTQQIHYMINRRKSGIFHLGAEDLIHHEEFFTEILKSLNVEKPLFKNVYTSNFDRFLAVLPRDNKLPKHLSTSNQETLEYISGKIKE
ncbi:sugar nucleotide-binding protein [Kordia sp.]|uniref:sugar nucleotide-binding protein n=1 Tax=Kordia sp. TaxID=1965332 RepID=UPI0025C3B48F|nr:sugar nucleotide-binding protein [Kordia sp.]MCH2193876.1 sugar nucleotide-binding protein [Kordia sp.]